MWRNKCVYKVNSGRNSLPLISTTVLPENVLSVVVARFFLILVQYYHFDIKETSAANSLLQVAFFFWVVAADSNWGLLFDSLCEVGVFSGGRRESKDKPQQELRGLSSFSLPLHHLLAALCQGSQCAPVFCDGWFTPVNNYKNHQLLQGQQEKYPQGGTRSLRTRGEKALNHEAVHKLLGCWWTQGPSKL